MELDEVAVPPMDMDDPLGLATIDMELAPDINDHRHNINVYPMPGRASSSHNKRRKLEYERDNGPLKDYWAGKYHESEMEGDDEWEQRRRKIPVRNQAGDISMLWISGDDDWTDNTPAVRNNVPEPPKGDAPRFFFGPYRNSFMTKEDKEELKAKERQRLEDIRKWEYWELVRRQKDDEFYKPHHRRALRYKKQQEAYRKYGRTQPIQKSSGGHVGEAEGPEYRRDNPRPSAQSVLPAIDPNDTYKFENLAQKRIREKRMLDHNMAVLKEMGKKRAAESKQAAIEKRARIRAERKYKIARSKQAAIYRREMRRGLRKLKQEFQERRKAEQERDFYKNAWTNPKKEPERPPSKIKNHLKKPVPGFYIGETYPSLDEWKRSMRPPVGKHYALINFIVLSTDKVIRVKSVYYNRYMPRSVKERWNKLPTLDKTYKRIARLRTTQGARGSFGMDLNNSGAPIRQLKFKPWNRSGDFS